MLTHCSFLRLYTAFTSYTVKCLFAGETLLLFGVSLSPFDRLFKLLPPSHLFEVILLYTPFVLLIRSLFVWQFWKSIVTSWCFEIISGGRVLLTHPSQRDSSVRLHLKKFKDEHVSFFLFCIYLFFISLVFVWIYFCERKCVNDPRQPIKLPIHVGCGAITHLFFQHRSLLQLHSCSRVSASVDKKLLVINIDRVLCCSPSLSPFPLCWSLIPSTVTFIGTHL